MTSFMLRFSLAERPVNNLLARDGNAELCVTSILINLNLRLTTVSSSITDQLTLGLRASADLTVLCTNGAIGRSSGSLTRSQSSAQRKSMMKMTWMPLSLKMTSCKVTEKKNLKLLPPLTLLQLRKMLLLTCSALSVKETTQDWFGTRSLTTDTKKWPKECNSLTNTDTSGPKPLARLTI